MVVRPWPLAKIKPLCDLSCPLLRVWVLLIPESCKLQNSSNPMFDANFIDAQHQADLSLLLPSSYYRDPASGSMPRSIFAIRS